MERLVHGLLRPPGGRARRVVRRQVETAAQRVAQEGGGGGRGVDEPLVLPHRFPRRTRQQELALVEQHGPVRQLQHHRRRVRHEEHRASGFLELAYAREALALERLVAHRQRLVHDQHVRVHVDGHREGQAHVHPLE